MQKMSLKIIGYLLCIYLPVSSIQTKLFPFFSFFFFHYFSPSMQAAYKLLNRQSFDAEKDFEEHPLTLPSYDEEQARIPHRHAHSGLKGHIEEHFSRPELVRDCILGLSDGLTVPFALAAGLSSLGDSRIVIFGGLAGMHAHRVIYEEGYKVFVNIKVTIYLPSLFKS